MRQHIIRQNKWRAQDNLALAATPAFGWLLLFFSGALGYGLLEIFWRGYTHWSMQLAGGICLVGLNYLDVCLPGCGDWHKAWLGGLLITAIELLFGIACNLWLGLGVWDYSLLPYNFLGQICLPFAFVWLGLARLLLYPVRWLRPIFSWSEIMAEV